MITLLRKLTCFFLLITFQSHFLLASPPRVAGKKGGAVASLTSKIHSISRVDASSYNLYRLYHSYYQPSIFPRPFSPPTLDAHPSSGPVHHLPSPVPVQHLPPPTPVPQLPIPVPHPAPSNPASHPLGSDDAIKIFLYEHNKVRSLYGASELIWNPDLISAAKRVTDTCTFKHTVDNPFGENIAAGQTSPEQVVSQWVSGPDEKSAYDPSNPRDSHFTQVVWRESREIGCAVTSCSTLAGASLPQSPILFWACEYNPPGNVETLYLKNVHAAAGGAPLQR